MTNAQAFQVGTHYYCRSVCDHECIWTYTVLSRTSKFLTIQEIRDGQLSGEPKRVGISSHYVSGAECVYPQGRYSMAPVLTPDKIAA